jgi:hypothetical protein
MFASPKEKIKIVTRYSLRRERKKIAKTSQKKDIFTCFLKFAKT